MGLDPSSGRQDMLPLTTRVSDVFSGFPIQPMQLLLKYDSELALHRSCCRSSKQDGSVSLGTWHGWAIRKTRPEPYIYVDSRVTQGLESPPRTSTPHLATDLRSRRPAAQSRSELSLATRSEPRTMEATRGNGYAPVRSMPAMMMMMSLHRKCSALNVDFNGVRRDPLGLRSPPYERVKIWVPP